MNVWPETLAEGRRALVGSEGELVSVSIAVEARSLERLLEALAGLAFPINPQIYHEASVVRVFLDGRRDVQPATIVEFPAWAARTAEIRDAVRSAGLDPASVWTHSMLEQLHAEFEACPAPAGSPYSELLRYRRLMTAA